MTQIDSTNRVLPTGTVTFLFSDIEGSTRLLHQLGDREYAHALAQHRRVLRSAFAARDGIEIETEGDSFFVAFALPWDAVAAAVEGQRGLAGGPVTVRMGLHAGEPLRTAEGYVGMVVHRAARISAVAHGGQVLLSEAVAALAGDRLPSEARLRDLGQVRLKDLEKPEHVYQVLHPQLRESFPALRSLEETPNNLPQQLTSFVGREQELAEVRRLLGTSRLVTVVGVGGLGKTRLGLQAGADALEDFSDGVWLVELASLTDARLVPQAVASVLGVKEEAGRPVQEALVKFVKDRQLLLVLDNCEHLLQACAELAKDLLDSGAQVRVLATSRELLRVDGEQSYPLPALSLPHATGSADDVGRSEAVQLFVERARRQRPSFALTEERAPAVAQLCIHLEGIPLALELAAARTRSLSVEELVARIDDRFRLLTVGARTALPRHQTLRGVIDWSYDLLSGDERTLFRRLAVFAGGFTLDAAEQVCSGDGCEQGGMLDLLTALTDKSLISVEERAGATRYRMLETVRQYAAERLVQGGSSAAIRERHRNYYLALAEKADPKLTGVEQAEWLRRLELEHDNFRASLTYGIEEPGSKENLRFCAALQRFWWVRGHVTEGRSWCSQALAKAGDCERTPEHAKALGAAGTLARMQCDYPVARARYEESLAIQQQLGDRRGIAALLNNLGNVACNEGDLAAGKKLFEQCVAIMRELDDSGGIATVLNNLGNLARIQGDYDSALALHEEGLTIMRELGDSGGISISLNSLGNVAFERGEFGAARALHEESLAIDQERGDRHSVANTLCNLGTLACRENDFVSARALHIQSMAIRRELHARQEIAESLEGLAEIAAGLGAHFGAARVWGAAERLREELGSPLPANEAARHDAGVAEARTTSRNADAFDHAWQEGRDLTVEQAIELALEEPVERK
jgi:predicted ATPase/class 3 adenylate cyclase/Tfp pilus assembly protein PilF